MTIHEIMDFLFVRLEDLDEDAYESTELIKAVENAIIRVANEIHSSYLTELQTIQPDVTVSSGKIALASALTYKVLRGGEGVKKVVVGGVEAKKLDAGKTKRLENQFHQGTLKSPKWYVYANNIYIYPTTVAKADVWYLKVPDPLLYEFTCVAANPAATTEFLGDADQGLSTSDDAYNGTTDKERVVIYNVTKDAYFVVTDYDATGNAKGDRLFTVSPAADANFGTGSFYFCTHSFDQLNLANLTFELNAGLRNLVLDFAEAEAWGMGKELERKNSVLASAMAELTLLNDKYKESRVGEKSRR